jgi:hypothetical protein
MAHSQNRNPRRLNFLNSSALFKELPELLLGLIGPVNRGYTGIQRPFEFQGVAIRD